MNVRPLRRAELTRPLPRLVRFASLAWLVLFVALNAATDDAPCTASDPCGADWVGGIGPFLVLCMILLPPLVPDLVLALSGLTLLYVLPLVLLDPQGLDGPAAVAGLLVTEMVTMLLWQLDVQRRPGPPDGPTAVWTGPQVPPRGAAQRGWGVGVASLGLALFLLSVGIGVHEHQRESNAQKVTGTVVSAPTDTDANPSTLRVSARGRTHAVDVSFPEDYEAGEQLLVYADDEGPFRVVGEPFDASPGAFSSLLLASVGGALVWRGVRRRRSDLAVMSSPQPVYLVRVAPWGGGLRVFEADDTEAQGRPLAVVPSIAGYPAERLEDLVQDAWTTQRAYLVGKPLRGRLVYIRVADFHLVPLAGVKRG